jgi:hypothetical protein
MKEGANEINQPQERSKGRLGDHIFKSLTGNSFNLFRINTYALTSLYDYTKVVDDGYVKSTFLYIPLKSYMV